jgi:hypothetical protein
MPPRRARRCAALALALSALTPAARAAPPTAPWQNASLPVAARVANLISLLTLEEKVANLYANAAPGAPRLGLGAYRYDEECMRGAVTSGVARRPLGTGLPTLLALSGTFNVSLLAAAARVGVNSEAVFRSVDSYNLPRPVDWIGGPGGWSPGGCAAPGTYAFVDALRLFRIGYSWAGPMSLVVPYDLNGMREPGALARPHLKGHLVRFSLGLEAVDDLRADLAQALARGEDGYAVDLPRALDMYERAAGAAGAEDTAVRVNAHLGAGAMLYRGLGCAVSYPRALAHYRAAAELNSVEAWECIASMHANGEGLERDEGAARAILAMVKSLRQQLEASAARAGEAEVGAGAGAATAAAAAAGGEGSGAGGCGKAACACKS